MRWGPFAETFERSSRARYADLDEKRIQYLTLVSFSLDTFDSRSSKEYVRRIIDCLRSRSLLLRCNKAVYTIQSLKALVLLLN